MNSFLLRNLLTSPSKYFGERYPIATVSAENNQKDRKYTLEKKTLSSREIDCRTVFAPLRQEIIKATSLFDSCRKFEVKEAATQKLPGYTTEPTNQQLHWASIEATKSCLICINQANHLYALSSRRMQSWISVHEVKAITIKSKSW